MVVLPTEVAMAARMEVDMVAHLTEAQVCSVNIHCFHLNISFAQGL